MKYTYCERFMWHIIAPASLRFLSEQGWDVSKPKKKAKAIYRQIVARTPGIRRAVMLTGDSERTAAAIAAEVGVDEYRAEILPADKASFVEAERANGHTVIMIGDGINDSPALSKANVGILPPATSATLHNLSTLSVSLQSMTNLLELK